MPQLISTMQWLGVLLVATSWPSLVRGQGTLDPELQEKCMIVRENCYCNGSVGDIRVSVDVMLIPAAMASDFQHSNSSPV